MNSPSSKSKWIIAGIISLLVPVFLLALNFETVMWSVLGGGTPLSTLIVISSIPVGGVISVVCFYMAMFGEH